MTAIYGFTDAKRFAVLCADNHSPSAPVDKIVRVGSSHFVGVSGQPYAVTLLQRFHYALKRDQSLGRIEDFISEFARRIRRSLEWYLPAFEEESRRREKLPKFEEWDRLMRMSPIRLAVLDVRDLSLHEIHFGWPLPPGKLRAVPQHEVRAPLSLWRFGITAPREKAPDTDLLQANPAAVFGRLLEEDRGPGIGTLGSLITFQSGRLTVRSSSGRVDEETRFAS